LKDHVFDCVAVLLLRLIMACSVQFESEPWAEIACPYDQEIDVLVP
jgi:hypothetical protein